MLTLGQIVIICSHDELENTKVIYFRVIYVIGLETKGKSRILMKSLSPLFLVIGKRKEKVNEKFFIFFFFTTLLINDRSWIIHSSSPQ